MAAIIEQQQQQMKYRPVAPPKTRTPENEIRVSGAGRIANYVTYAHRLFTEQGKSLVIIRATGRAVATAVSACEVIKRRFAGLHQVTEVGVTQIMDSFEPTEEGLDPVEKWRSMPYVAIQLTKDESLIDKTCAGYQPPIDDDLVVPYDENRAAAGRGRGRGGRGRGGGRDFRDSRDVRDIGRDGGYSRIGGGGNGGGNGGGADRAPYITPDGAVVTSAPLLRRGRGGPRGGYSQRNNFYDETGGGYGRSRAPARGYPRRDRGDGRGQMRYGGGGGMGGAYYNRGDMVAGGGGGGDGHLYNKAPGNFVPATRNDGASRNNTQGAGAQEAA